jgi:hypothetical protein
MQSSAMVALRTMIMIVCLVAVPLAAVLGTALPKVVKSAFGYHEPRQAAVGPENEPAPRAAARALATDDVERRVAEATPNELGPPAAETLNLPRARITGVRTVDDEPSAAPIAVASEPMVETAPLWNPSPRTASTPRDRPTTTHLAPPPLRQEARKGQKNSNGGRREISYDARPRAERRDDALQKTVYSPPAAQEEETLGRDVAGIDKGAPTDDGLVAVERVANAGPLADGEGRLRQLGAIYFKLEMWGNDGTFYRCSCSVPLSPRGRAVRHFESIETVPSQALDAVIKQVEAWRARRAAH